MFIVTEYAALTCVLGALIGSNMCHSFYLIFLSTLKNRFLLNETNFDYSFYKGLLVIKLLLFMTVL